MSSKHSTPSPQAKRLAFLIAAHDGREGSDTAAERFHQKHIEEAELSGDEIGYLSDKLEAASDSPRNEYSEKMLLARFIADAVGTKSIHFLFVIARCSESISVIANHNTGSYSDYPVVNVMDIYNRDLKPKGRWGRRLDSTVYDRMASILVARYLEKTLALDVSCMLRIDMYREVIEPLLNNETVVRLNLGSIFKVIEAVAEGSVHPYSFMRRDVTIDVHDVIRLATMIEAHKTNLARILFLVRERGVVDVNALETHLAPVPALTGGSL